MRFGRGIVLALAALATPIAAQAPIPASAWPSGIYSNVRMSGETGDLGGMEIRFYTLGGKRMVEFVHCEGWCNQSYHAELRQEGDGFAFEYTEILTSSDGPEKHRVKFTFKRAGQRLEFVGWYDGALMDQFGQRWLLTRQSRMFGLDVANGR